MEALHLGVITLLRSALKGEKLSLPESFDLGQAFDILYNHHLLGLGIQGALLCGVSRTHPALVQMTASFCGDLKKSRGQMEKLGEVCAVFDENNIEYLPVKGAVIKPLYPKAEYRVMGDADILIRPEQYSRIQPILQKLGFSELDNSDYEYTWKCPELTLELHRHLVAPRFKSYFTYYSDSWRLAKRRENSSQYLLSPEEHFIYLIVHFAKHYLFGSICAKDICDFYVWRVNYPDMDEKYIEEKLGFLKLLSFYRNILDLLNSWFNGEGATKATELITRSAFLGGVCEDFDESAINNRMRQHADGNKSIFKMKFLWFIRSVFPSPSELSYKYPALAKKPLLLPVFWVVHWFNALFKNRAKIKRGMLVLKMNKGKLSKYDEHIQQVGLDTNGD